MMKRTLLTTLVLLGAPLCLAAGTPEDLFKEGQQLEKDGKVSQAAKVYESFLKQHADHTQAPEVTYRLAKCYDALGYPDETAKALKKVLEADKTRFKQRTEAQYMLAKLYGSLKKYPEAIETCEKMLAEGAGLYEDEVLNTSALYYALLGKYDEAASKYNILSRRDDPKLAKSAAHKLALLWVKAEKLDLAVNAIQDYARQYPGDEQIPELLLRAADLFVKHKKPERAAAICEVVKTNFKDSPEAVGAGYIMGMIYRERKDYKQAAQTLDQMGKAAARDNRLKSLAAEALAQAAEVYYYDLHDAESAVPRYEEAAGYARESDSERAVEILQQCYFRLGEHYFAQKKWAAAMDRYLMLRNLGTNVNILPRIVACQAQLGTGNPISPTASNADRQVLEQKMKDNPGTAIAAEAEIFLLDSRLNEALKRKSPTAQLAPEYEKLLSKYPKDVLSQEHLGAYICLQMGATLAQLPVRDDLLRALKGYEKALEMDPAPDNPYLINALENIALLARQVDDKAKAHAAEQKLFRLKKAELDKSQGDKEAGRKTLEYMKTLFSHSDTAELAQESIEAAQKLIEEKGPLSELSREAKFYIGELHYLKKDFSSAARTFKEYIKIYGPPQGPDGELAHAPWKPAGNAEAAERVHEAAVRIAHAWFMQGHEQNMVKQYEWIVRNMPVNNRWLPEAQYWLAMELGRGEKGKLPENKRKMAETLWKNIVHPSTDFDDPRFSHNFHPWTRSNNVSVQSYVKSAILKSGQVWGELADHELAVGAFKSYLYLFPQREPRKDQPVERDEMGEIARYALGLEYLALKNHPKFIETCTPYTGGLRQDRFRVSALRMLGFHAAQAQAWDVAMDAYATLLDEYGPNKTDAAGNPIPVPQKDRLRERSGRSGGRWDGIRMAVPKDLDLGEVRYSLGYLYWKQEVYTHCAQTLAPFETDPALRSNKHRDRALFMAGQSFYRLYDYRNGTRLLLTLVRDHPRFEAIEEAYVHAARGCVETKNWDDLALLCRNFVNEWGKSERRPRMDLFNALGQIGSGKAPQGSATLLSIAKSDTYEDVRADAYYHLGRATVASNPEDTARAYDYLAKSVSLFAQDTSCLEAGRLAMKLRKWDDARQYLERVGRDFPKGNPDNVKEAKALLPEVMKQLVRPKP